MSRRMPTHSWTWGASVNGGQGNFAEGACSTVGGGLELLATGDFDWVAKGLPDDDDEEDEGRAN